MRRVLLLLMLAGLLALATAAPAFAQTPDTTAPTVTAVAPAGLATGVAVNANVTVTFSEPVTGVDSTSFMLINGGSVITSRIGVAADRLSATLYPDEDLANYAFHTVIVYALGPATTGVTDDAGNPMLENFNSSFTTVAPPGTAPLEVTIYRAAPDPTNASPINFTVVFSELVSDFVTEDVTLSGTAGATTVTVTPISPTQDATTPAAMYNVAVSGMTQDGTVTVDIHAGVASSDATGAPNLASTSTDNTVIFDTTAPTVISVTPVDGATGVPVITNVTVTFSEAVNGSKSLRLTAAAYAITGTVTVAADRLSATYDPGANLANYNLHFVSVASGAPGFDGVTDDAGNPMAANFNSSFTTVAPPDTTAPTVTAVDPANSTGLVAVTTSVKVTFSEAVNIDTVTSSTFTVNNGTTNIAGIITVAPGGLSATFAPDVDLANDTTHTVAVTSGVTDTSGNSLDQDPDVASSQAYTSTFTTAAATTETIDIIKATFSSRKSEFKVEATSTLGGPPDTNLRARLSIDDGANWSVFEDMTYATNKDKWSLTFSNVTNKPTNVQVCSTTTTTCVERTDLGDGNRNGRGKKSK